MHRPRESVMSNTSPTALLLNVGHALDHLFLLIFAFGQFQEIFRATGYH